MELCGSNQQIIIRKFHVGKVNPIEAILLYKDGLVNQDIINRDILNPLMHQVNEDLSAIELINEYVCDKYISMSKITVENDININSIIEIIPALPMQSVATNAIKSNDAKTNPKKISLQGLFLIGLLKLGS